ncbi:MAG: cyclodeaminase/cyclohydrolase family protein [Acidobacteriota bacterium]
MLIDRTLAAFADELASNSPAPGGGSIAALSGALAAGLTSMVCRLTLGKKKYADVQDEIESILVRSEDVRARFTQLIDRDTDAFNAVMKAYGMPKESDEEKSARAAAVEASMKDAVRVPLDVMRCARELSELTARAKEIGNRNSVTDAGVAALMLQAACRGAAFNVKINLGSIADQEFVRETSRTLAEIEASTLRLSEETVKGVESSFSSVS